jgi:transcriptional regulator with XRE-family HTH domain
MSNAHPAKSRAIGQKLASARQAKGLTQQQTAQQLNVDKAAVSRWELGHIEPQPEMLQKLCDLYGVTVDSILAG